MQVPFGYSVRNYAPAACAPCTKPRTGKSFTIEALLAKPQETAASPPPLAPPSYLYPANMVQTQPGYSLYCCSPFSYPTCRGGFYAQAAMSKVTPSLHSFKPKGGKSKRMRTSFTSEQLSRLEKEFARQQYMVGSERFLLASALQLTEAQVKVWFQNRRIKWRKQSLEQQQAKLAKLGLAAPPKSPGSQGRGDEGAEEFSDSDVDVNVSDDITDQ